MGSPQTRFSIRFEKLITDGDTTENSFLNISDGKVHSTTDEPLFSQEDFDFSTCTLVPGLIDIHTHGYGGTDSMSDITPNIGKWAKNIVKSGVTGFVPACVSTSFDGLVRFIKNIDKTARMNDGKGASILGSRLEGPYISKEKSGAHDRKFIHDPIPEEIRLLKGMKEHGLRIIDMAPELNGASEAVSQLTEAGILVSAGHSNCSFEAANSSVELGVPLFTHFFNAMSPLHHRNPGMVGAGLLNRKVKLEIIADLKHVSKEVIEITSRMRGWENIVLVTDSISAAGLGDGSYRLGTMEVEVKDGLCFIAGTDTLAGSTLTLDSALRNMVESGFDLEEVVSSATSIPAGLLGLTDRGSLMPGMRADICVLDDKLRVKRTFIGGVEVYNSGKSQTQLNP